MPARASGADPGSRASPAPAGDRRSPLSADSRALPASERQTTLDWLLQALSGWLQGASGVAGAELPTPPHWPLVDRLGREHNLRPLLHRLHEERLLPPPAVPSQLAAGWEESYYLNYTFNLELLRRLGELLELGRDAGIELIAIKGPEAIARRYGDPALRVLVDLDLVCRPADLERLAGIMTSRGYSPVGETTSYHHVWADPELAASVELHFDLYDTIASREEFLAAIRDGAETVRAGEVELTVPSPEACLILELAHLLQHDLVVDLRHLLDFALALVKAPPETADRLAPLLELTDLGPEFGRVRELIGRLFELPPTPFDGFESGVEEAGAELLPACRETLLDLDEQARPRALAGAAARPGALRRGRYLSGLLLPTGERLRALAAGRRGGPAAALVRHLGQTGRRGWRKLRRHGPAGEPQPLAAVRRDLYLRRDRE